MSLKEFRSLSKKLVELSEKIRSENIDLVNPAHQSFLSFDETKKSYYVKQLKSTILVLEKKVSKLSDIRSYKDNARNISDIETIIFNLNTTDISALINQSRKLSELVSLLEHPEGVSITISGSIPREIREEIAADVVEMEKCFNSGSYRSVVILCGRIIEVLLHRKYYDATGHDILEKNPGIGLGKLIAKLIEKEVSFEPGLTQQIHLINQVRVFSVHKKQEPFYPSKTQAHAMMLYTMDVMEKMFS